jgi:hypothetical protein
MVLESNWVMVQSNGYGVKEQRLRQSESNPVALESNGWRCQRATVMVLERGYYGVREQPAMVSPI